VDQAILKKAPAPAYKLNANLDDKVELVGLDITPAKPNPGDKITLNFYWKVLETIQGDNDWMIFVHVEGPVPGGGVARVNGDHHAIEDGPGGAGLFPMREWKKGQIIKDTKTLDLVDPKNRKIGPGEVVVYVGVFDMDAYRTKQKDIRMELKNTDKVKNDGNNRIEAARFPVGKVPAKSAKAKPTPPTQLSVRSTIDTMNIDGKLDEKSWRAALTSGAFKKPDGSAPLAAMHTRMKLLWDKDALYVGFMVRDRNPTSPFAKRDEELWKADVVEVYLDPDRDGKNYVELQLSPKNVIFDALFTDRRKPEWKKAAEWNLAGITSAISIGELPGAGKHNGWTAEIRIPFAGLASIQGKVPSAGQTWNANFFRVEPPGDFDHLGAWSAVSNDRRPDFHNLARAGQLTFVNTPTSVKDRVLSSATPVKAAKTAVVAADPTKSPKLPTLKPTAPAAKILPNAKAPKATK